MKARKELRNEQMEQVTGGSKVMPGIAPKDLMHRKGQTNNPALLGNAVGRRNAANMASDLMNMMIMAGKETTSVPVGHPNYGKELI